jgi:hypothetical protein
VLDSLLESQTDARARALEAQLRPLLGKLPGLAGKLRPVGALLELRAEPVWAVMPFHVEVK